MITALILKVRDVGPSSDGTVGDQTMRVASPAKAAASSVAPEAQPLMPVSETPPEFMKTQKMAAVKTDPPAEFMTTQKLDLNALGKSS